MSYDISAISRITSVPLPQDSTSARVAAPRNGLEGITQGPIITSTMFPPDEINNVAFPPNDPERVRYTYASFHREQYASVPDQFSDRWELIVPIQIPTNYIIPKLLSLEYTLKYASAHDRGNSTLQSDIILSTVSLPSGVRRLKERDHEVYRDMENAYGPRAVRKDIAWNLATSFGVKPKGGLEGWGHYIDHQRIKLGIRLTRLTGSTSLYFVLSVLEYPSSDTVRSVAVEVTSKWEDANTEANIRNASREDRHVAFSRPSAAEILQPEIRPASPSTVSIREHSRAGSVVAETPHFFTRPVTPPPPAPAQRVQPPVEVPINIQAPQPQVSCHGRRGHVIYERFYAPPPGC